MGLEKKEEQLFSCAYEGHEGDCPKDCLKCAIAIKKAGDAALDSNHLNEAIKQYKKALFVEPKFAKAWCNLGNAFAEKSEYNNALSAYNKAIAIDSQYGEAMFGKAKALRYLGKIDAAIVLVNEILELYDEQDVRFFKEELLISKRKQIVTKKGLILPKAEEKKEEPKKRSGGISERVHAILADTPENKGLPLSIWSDELQKITEEKEIKEPKQEPIPEEPSPEKPNELTSEERRKRIELVAKKHPGMHFYLSERTDGGPLSLTAEQLLSEQEVRQKESGSPITEEIPKSYGYSADNPIIVRSVASEYRYLSSLIYDKGEIIDTDRLGSTTGLNSDFVDIFLITVRENRIEKKITLYLDGYGKMDSTHAPHGFHLQKW